MADLLAGFYEEAYTRDPAKAMLYARWRALGARGKAEHAISLCRAEGLAPTSTLEVGCGDGAVLCELRRRGFGGHLEGLEIAPQAVAIASERAEIDAVELYDGERLPFDAGTFALGLLSHVLEHVHDPAGLLAEVARVCGAVVVEVPLEDNLSARRKGKREHAGEVGHVQRLSRKAMRAIVADAGLRVADLGDAGPRVAAGLRVAGELEDPLPRAVHGFFAHAPAARAKASAKWATRATLHRLTPPLARALFTVHYACLCVPMDGCSPVR